MTTTTFTDPSRVVFAIDYGTSNSLLAATDGRVTTSPLALDPQAPDPTVLRSVLFFPHGNQCFYGQEAIAQYGEHQAGGRLIRSIKKYLPSESFIGSWIDDRVVKLEDLIGIFLLEMRKRAQRVLDCEVERVLLGRPAKFSEDPVKDKLAEYRLKKAAEFAGFKHIDFLPEPLAAAFDLRKRLAETKTVLVVDLGGGTSDFTVIRIGPEAFQESDVLAMGGVSIAGDAVDGEFMKTTLAPYFGSKVRYRVPLGSNFLEMPKSLLDHICSPADIAQLRRSDYMDFFRNVQQWAPRAEDKAKLDRLFALVEDQLGFQLFEEIDRVKRAFTTEEASRFIFDYPDIDLDFEVIRVDFEAFISTATEKMLATMDETLRAAQVPADKIDIVYCTGGTSKLRNLQRGLRTRFPEEKIMRHNYFHSVIEGLTARAGELATI
jgi:hypothetical chaperone protein